MTQDKVPFSGRGYGKKNLNIKHWQKELVS